MATKDEILDSIDKNYDIIFPCITDLENDISNLLDSAGVFYRIFSKRKKITSIKKKVENKAEIKYIPEESKMQDIIGFRIVLYYADDVDVCIELLRSIFKVNNFERDQLDTATFKPCRTNYVFDIPEESSMRLPQQISNDCYIDNTFEVQIRTIFSEGWHEVEHDIRYKFREDWENQMGLSRELNGLFAVLEICEHDIISICDKFAYENYKCGNWEAMIRNKYRLRFQERGLQAGLEEYLNQNKEIAKRIFRFKREKLIKILWETKLPINYDNIVYVVNFFEAKDATIQKLTPKIVLKKLEKCREDAEN
jgi:putative GTP pyrophosphokinase